MHDWAEYKKLVGKWYKPKNSIKVSPDLDFCPASVSLTEKLSKPFKLLKILKSDLKLRSVYVEILTLEEKIPRALYAFNAMDLEPYQPNELEILLYS